MISIPWAIYDWHNGQVPFEAISGFLLGLAALMGYFYEPNQTISASNAGAAVGRDVINSEIHTHIHPPGATKPKSLSYQPPKPPKPGDIPDHGDLPPGSRMTFLQNAVFTGRQDDLIELAGRDTRVLNGLAEGHKSCLDEIITELLELGSRELHLEMLGPVLISGDEG